MDAFAGAIGISDSDGRCTPEYIVLDPRSGSAHAGYFSQLLRHAARQQFILVQCPAVRERAPRFRYPNFGCVWMPLPPASEQAAIARFLAWATNRLDRAIGAKRRIIALLQEQKQAIIHRAVTGGAGSLRAAQGFGDSLAGGDSGALGGAAFRSLHN